MKKYTWELIAIVSSLALGPVLAQAGVITHEFTVTATSGPLNGTSSTGTFSYNENIIPVGGGRINQTGLFTDFTFIWNGISYDETTANTGSLAFDSSGNLNTLFMLFGDSCSSSGCSVSAFTNEWYVIGSLFQYAIPTSFVFEGIVQVNGPPTSVAEPASLVLLGLGLTGLIGWRRQASF